MERPDIIARLEKIGARLKGKEAKWPPSFSSCPTCGKDISFELAGAFLKDNLGAILEALRRVD